MLIPSEQGTFVSPKVTKSIMRYITFSFEVWKIWRRANLLR